MVIVVVKLGALHFDVAAGLGGGAGTRFHCPSLDQKLLVLHAADVCSWHRVRCSLLHAWIGAITEDLDMLFLDFPDLLLQHLNFVFQQFNVVFTNWSCRSARCKSASRRAYLSTEWAFVRQKWIVRALGK